MNGIKKLFLLLYFISITSTEPMIIECESNQTTIFLEPKTVYFLQSVNFPASMKDDCKIDFLVKNYEKYQDFYVQFSFTNNQLLQNPITPIFIDPNRTDLGVGYYYRVKEIKLEITFDGDYENYNAFQAMVLLEIPAIDACPFNSISTYEFTDEAEALSISSLYFDPASDFESYDMPCTWKFSAPNDYKFKVDVNLFSSISFGVQPNSTLEFDNGQDIQTVDAMTISPAANYVIYGNELTITYMPVLTVMGTYPFIFVISIAKLLPLMKEENCAVAKSENQTLWTNIGKEMSGYSPNAQCSFFLEVPWKNEIMLTPDILNIIAPDTINMYVDNIAQPLDFDAKPVIYFQSRKDGKNKNVLFEFVSDGNMQSLGFQLKFVERECTCAPEIVIAPCQDIHYFSILNDTKDQHFCSYMNCKFTLIVDPKCPEKNIWFSIDATKIVDNNTMSNTEMFVYSGNFTVFNSTIDYFNIVAYNLLLLNSQTNILEFSTSGRGSIAFTVKTLDPVRFLPPIIMNSSSYILDTIMIPANSAFTIQLDDSMRDDILEFYAYQGIPYFIFFTDETLTQKYDIYRHENDMVKYKFPTNTVTMYLSVVTFDLVLFHAVYTPPKNCLFKNNIFYRDNGQFNSIVSTVAEKIGTCEIIIITDLVMRKVWTTSGNETVKMYTVYNDLFLEYNQNTSSIWNEINVHAMIYIITIPPGASIALNLETRVNDMLPTDITTYPYKTMWSSTNFGGRIRGDIYDIKKFNIGDKINATFKIKFLSPHASITLNNQNGTEIGQTFDFTNVNVTVVYTRKQADILETGFLIEIEASPVS